MVSRTRRSRWLVLLGVLATSGFVAHCGSSDDEGGDNPYGGSGSVADANRDTTESTPDVLVVPDGSGGTSYHPACGVVSCVPDQPLGCASQVASQGGASGAGGTPSSAGGESAGGAGGAESSAGGAGGVESSLGGAGAGAGGDGQGGAAPPLASGGVPGSAEGGAAGAAGNGGEGNGAPEYSCQVTVTSDGPLAECLPAGARLIEETCLSTADCVPGLACVVTGSGNPPVSTCRPFCCAGDSSCTQGNYCDERPLTTDSGSVLEVPVCVPARPCSLVEPYPCDAGSCTCDPGEACLVVRADGTTTCAEPGMGQVGDPCPCAWGHVCSATNQCVRLCETARAEHYCGNAKCQASAELPEGWGVCVGPAPDASR
ncbi:MAG TPA: hypothetical protein VM686_28285 [Polyangiaceae bacterium]|nr:hypothetical protein [Polyangiaceae bacterium]